MQLVARLTCVLLYVNSPSEWRWLLGAVLLPPWGFNSESEACDWFPAWKVPKQPKTAIINISNFVISASDFRLAGANLKAQ